MAHKNSVKGVAHGKKRPEKEREQCIAELAAGIPLVEVAKKYNVPESTLRSWRRQAKSANNDEWSKVRAKYIDDICKSSASGASAAAELMQQRIKRSCKAEEIIKIYTDKLLHCNDDKLKEIYLNKISYLRVQTLSEFGLNNAFKNFAQQAMAKPDDITSNGVTINITGADKNYAD